MLVIITDIIVMTTDIDDILAIITTCQVVKALGLTVWSRQLSDVGYYNRHIGDYNDMLVQY